MFNNELISCNRAEQLFTANKNFYTHAILNYEEPGLHSHDYIEFFYVIEGRCLHLLNGATKQISGGDLFLLTPNDVHNFKNSDNNFAHRDIAFTVEFFHKMCNVYSQNLYDQILSNGFLKQTRLSGEQINELETFIQPFTLSAVKGKTISEDICESTVCTYLINEFLKKNLSSESSIPTWLSRLIALLSAPEKFYYAATDNRRIFPLPQRIYLPRFQKSNRKNDHRLFQRTKDELRLFAVTIHLLYDRKNLYAYQYRIRILFPQNVQKAIRHFSARSRKIKKCRPFRKRHPSIYHSARLPHPILKIIGLFR